MSDLGSPVLRELVTAAGSVTEDQVQRFCEEIAEARSVYVYGVGRCGCIMRTFAMRLMQMGFTTHFVGDTATPSAQPGDLLVAGSGSGETGRTVSIVRTAAELSLRTIAVTGTPDATLGRLCDRAIVLPGGNKNGAAGGAIQSIQPPGSLFEQVLFFFLERSTVELARDRDPEYAAVRRRHANLE